MTTTWLRPDHIRIGADGQARLGETRFKVKHLVLAQSAYGMTPEDMAREYGPCITLAQIHAGLAFYLDNKDALDAEIARDEEEVERYRREAESSPKYQMLIEKLKKHKESQARDRQAPC